MEFMIGQTQQPGAKPAAGALGVGAPADGGMIVDGDQKTFMAEVVDASRQVPVLVDFWATWCGPCRASLPHVESLYKKYHSKGLDIVSVSNDNSVKALKAFLKAHPQMSWPQLFDAKHPGWSPMATSFGISGIPTQFVIDRGGVLRHIIVGYSPNLAAKLTADIRPLLK